MNDFYRISELMLAILIQRYDKNYFIFDQVKKRETTSIQRYDKNYFIFDHVQKRETNWYFTGCQMPHFKIVLILYINLLNLS